MIWTLVIVAALVAGWHEHEGCWDNPNGTHSRPVVVIVGPDKTLVLQVV